MSFHDDEHSVLPDIERFRTAIMSHMRNCQKTAPPPHSPYRILSGYVYMTNRWTGIFNIIKKSGTYRLMPVLNPYEKENEGLLTFDNKEEAIHALLAFRKVLDEIPAQVKFIRLDKMWLEQSIIKLGLNFDPSPPAKGLVHPEAVYLLYLYIAW